MALVLILDDELPLLQSLSLELERSGHECLLAEDGRSALLILEQQKPDIAILDVQLPDMSGLDVLRRLRADLPEVPVLIITAFASVDTAVEAMKEGALDYLEKPLDLEELQLVVERVLQNARLRSEVEAYRRDPSRAPDQNQIVGTSTKVRQIRDLVTQLAQLDVDRASDFPTVLIDGETGTGKDLLARNIHVQSPLANHPFVQVNCSGLPRELVESELFGHERGSFTGATQRKQGLFEVARGGTIFLDEIGDMPLDVQTKLLGVLESKRARRVGATREYPVDVRIIAATNRDLAQAIQERSFRSDLYYRLKVVHVRVPPLRERAEDIPLLAEFFLARCRRKYRRPDLTLDASTLTQLMASPWPGNIRELAHAIERMALISAADSMAIGDSEILARSASPTGATDTAPRPTVLHIDFRAAECNLESIERRVVEAALAFADGNVSEASRVLGLSRGALRHRLEKWGLEG
ncbi:MAG: sigma-54-dependent transcriptional regulator [Planctomycetota bacterium]